MNRGKEACEGMRKGRVCLVQACSHRDRRLDVVLRRLVRPGMPGSVGAAVCNGRGYLIIRSVCATRNATMVEQVQGS